MSDDIDNPAEVWIVPLAKLLNRWIIVDSRGYYDFKTAFFKSLCAANCHQLDAFLFNEQPAPHLTDDAEKAALRAILGTLGRVYDDPVQNARITPVQRLALQNLRGALAEAAQRRLEQPNQWEGDDWDALPRLQKRLLSHMSKCQHADLEELFPLVWEKPYIAGKNDVHVALSKANSFLVKRQWKRTLHKRRGKGEIYWD